MGRILAYGALIRSKVLLNSTVEIQLQTIQNLISAGKQRNYLSFVSVSFLVEFINQIDAQCIQCSVWPVVEKEFGKSWAEQTLDSFYILLVMKGKCPSLIDDEFAKKHFDTETIIAKESMSSIAQVLLVSIPQNFISKSFLIRVDQIIHYCCAGYTQTCIVSPSDI